MEKFHQLINRESPVLVMFFRKEDQNIVRFQNMLNSIEESKDFVLVARIDIEEKPDIAQEMGIEQTPTFIVFKNAEVVFKDIGETSSNRLEEAINKNR